MQVIEVLEVKDTEQVPDNISIGSVALALMSHHSLQAGINPEKILIDREDRGEEK
ncbi:MAG TPA: hypothetical protein VJH70_02675 [Candidatus Paceibacterota bacterium]